MMTQTAATISEGGRIVIPADFRHALGMEIGDQVIIRVVDGEIRIMTRKEALKRAQSLVRKYIPEGVSLVDELSAERRAEAARE